jgi:hypothetical protein
LLQDKKNNYRNTYIGNLTSVINIKGNQDFYNKNNNINNDKLYPDLPNSVEFKKAELL